MPSWLPQINKLVINRVQRLWAPYLPPYARVLHRGRRSGNPYRTPVVAFRSGADLVVALPYGDGADWVRNLLAAGEGEVVRQGRRQKVTDIRVTDTLSLGDRAPRPLRRVRRIKVLVVRAS